MGKQRWQMGEDDPIRQPTPPPKKMEDSGDSPRYLAEKTPVPQTDIRQLRRRRRMIIGASLLGLLAASFVVVLLWFDPILKPQLTILTARYRVSLLPPNSYAVQDARALCSLTELVRPPAALPQSQSWEEMDNTLSDLREAPEPRSWIFWQTSTRIIYVNAVGITYPDPNFNNATRAFLLPSDFQVPYRPIDDASRRMISFSSLLETVVKCRADQKVLVLDCQRLDQLFPMGMVYNGFVEQVTKELIEAETRLAEQNIHVLFSCAAGEFSWSNAPEKNSIFGREFAAALAGAADGFAMPDTSTAASSEAQVLEPKVATKEKDRRIDLEEVYAYISQTVDTWSRQHRKERQRPQLRSFGRYLPGNVVLTALGGSNYTTSVPSDPEQPVPLGNLRDAWEKYYTLLNSETAEISPYDYAPQILRSAEDSLLRAEQFWIASDHEAVANELKNVAAMLEEVNQARLGWEVPDDGPSLALRFLSPTSLTSTATPMAAPEDGAVLDARQLVLDVESGVQNILQAADQLSEARGLLPVEAQLLRMLGRFFPASTDPSLQAQRLAESKTLVSLRMLAEEAAMTKTPLGPDIFPWVRNRVEEADTSRRLREDRFFAANDRSILIRNPPNIALGAEEEQYRRALDQAQIVRRAIKMRNRLLAEVPYIVQRVSIRPWRIDDRSLQEQMRVNCEQLLDGLYELNQQLQEDPSSLSNDRVDARLEELNQTVNQLRVYRDDLLDNLESEAKRLGSLVNDITSPDEWRELQAAQLIPFPANRSLANDGDEVRNSPSESARIRINMIERLMKPIKQPPVVETNFLGGSTVEKWVENTALTLSRMYGMVRPDALSLETKSADQVRQVRESWRSLYTLATDAKSALRLPTASEIAYRILEPGAAQNSAAPTILARRRIRLAELFVWNAERIMDDFWASAPTKGEYIAAVGTPYFKEAADWYLLKAQEFHPEQKGFVASLDERLKNRVRALEEFGLESSPNEVVFRGTEQEEFFWQVSTTDRFPAGIGHLRLLADESVVTIGQVDQPTAFAYGYKATRRLDRATNSALETLLWYRGHIVKRNLILRMPDEEEGRVTLYHDDRPLESEVVVKQDASASQNMKLLFVLDCSRSMELNNRMSTLQSALANFSRAAPGGGIQVGVRLFGHRVVWNVSRDGQRLANDQSELQAKVDTELRMPIRPFDKSKYDRLVNNLVAVGETPMFYSLIQAVNDFNELESGDKRIILISDGVDNWVRSGNGPGLLELQEAYQGTGIQINCIGFQLQDHADFAILNQIATMTGGRAVPASESDELFLAITGFTGFLQWNVSAGTDTYPPGGQAAGKSLGPDSEPLLVPEGSYAINVFNRRDVDLSLRDQWLRRGGYHEFFFRNNTIEPKPIDYPQAIGRDPLPSDQSQVLTGIDPQNDPRTTLVVMVAKPESTTQGTRLQVRLGMYNDRYQETKQKHPERISVRLQPVGQPVIYSFHNLAPNVRKEPIPMWEFTVSPWVTNATRLHVSVTWDQGPLTEVKPYEIRWGEPGQTKLPEGFTITRMQMVDRDFGGQSYRAARITLTMPQNISPEQFMDWNFNFEEDVQYAQQIYNVGNRILTGYFVLSGERQPNQVMLYPPRPRRQGLIREVTVPVGVATINYP